MLPTVPVSVSVPEPEPATVTLPPEVAASVPAPTLSVSVKLEPGESISASVTPVQTAKGVVHRVRVGPFASEAEAEAALRKIHQAGQPGILVPQ